MWWILLPYNAIKSKVIPLCYIKGCIQAWRDGSGGCNNKYDKYFYVYRKQISNSQRSGLAQLGSYEFHGRESYCFGYVFFSTLITDYWNSWSLLSLKNHKVFEEVFEEAHTTRKERLDRQQYWWCYMNSLRYALCRKWMYM